MAPPSYADLGKSARDIFGKGYNHGVVKVDTTTKANDNGNIEFKTSASHDIATEKLSGSVDIKYKVPQHGVTLTEKWTTAGTLGTVLEVNNQFARNLKVTLDTLYNPNAVKREGTLKAEWFNDISRVNVNLSLNTGPIALASAVVGQNGWVAGIQGKFDVSNNQLKNTSVAFGYLGSNYTLHSFSNDGKEFGGSVYHRVHKNVELGAQVGWDTENKTTKFALGSTYLINPDLQLRTKIDNKAVVGISAQHVISPNVKAAISTQFSLTAANASNKLGVGFEYTP